MYSILDNIKSNEKNELIFIDENDKVISAEEASDIILSWNTADIPVDIFVKIENLLQKLQSDNINENLFDNEEVVISALNVKIIERENLLHPKKTNKDAFLDITNTNEDVREKMNFIETKNDEGKEIDYISIRNSDNTVDLLVCNSDTNIQDYIKEHGDEIPSRSAKEIFYDMNNMFRSPLEFQKLSEYTSDPTLSKEEEKEKVRSSVKSFGLDGHIYVAVDCFNERIYKIDDAIFKFDHKNEGSIEFLQEPRNMKNLNKQEEVVKNDNFLDEMLSTVDGSISSEPDEEYKELEEIDSYEGKNDIEYKESDKYIQFDPNIFNQLLKKAYQEKLEKSDIELLAEYIYILVNERNYNYLEDENQKKLDDFFYNYIYDKYDRACNVKKERIEEVMDLDLYNALRFLEQKNNQLNVANKEPIDDDYVQEEETVYKKSNGVALIVVLVEIVIVALILAMIFTINI